MRHGQAGSREARKDVARMFSMKNQIKMFRTSEPCLLGESKAIAMMAC
jgi:hypothetical protein